MVDGKENRDFWDCEYQTYTLRTSGYGEIFLKAGTHRIYVEYATIAQLPNYYSWEWPTNMVSVQYHLISPDHPYPLIPNTTFYHRARLYLSRLYFLYSLSD